MVCRRTVDGSLIIWPALLLRLTLGGLLVPSALLVFLRTMGGLLLGSSDSARALDGLLLPSVLLRATRDPRPAASEPVRTTSVAMAGAEGNRRIRQVVVERRDCFSVLLEAGRVASSLGVILEFASDASCCSPPPTALSRVTCTI